MKLENNLGQSMYELVVAIAIVALTLLAFVGLIISSLSASNYTRQKSLANSYVQEAMEWLRTQKDEDWNSFYSQAASHASGFCMGTLSWSGGGCSISGSEFERRAYFTVSGGDTVEARVEVTWQDARGVHTSESSTNFTNWRAN
jgi:Tfp pilus assembly protein PilV